MAARRVADKASGEALEHGVHVNQKRSDVAAGGVVQIIEREASKHELGELVSGPVSSVASVVLDRRVIPVRVRGQRLARLGENAGEPRKCESNTAVMRAPARDRQGNCNELVVGRVTVVLVEVAFKPVDTTELPHEIGLGTEDAPEGP